MVRRVLIGLLLWCIGINESPLTSISSVYAKESKKHHIKKSHKKKKSRQSKKHKYKYKKRKYKKRKRKEKIYSAHKIEELLRNDKEDKTCNRLNCASNLEIAKSCLPDKASHRSEKKCFRAFCAYGCNEEDYERKPEVRDFCNLTCASKKYLRKIK